MEYFPIRKNAELLMRAANTMSGKLIFLLMPAGCHMPDPAVIYDTLAIWLTRVKCWYINLDCIDKGAHSRVPTNICILYWMYHFRSSMLEGIVWFLRAGSKPPPLPHTPTGYHIGRESISSTYRQTCIIECYKVAKGIWFRW